MKKEFLQELLDYLKPLLTVLAIVLILNNFVIVNARVPSESMENTIMIKDRLIGNRLAYTFGVPERGDIVIFKAPDGEEKLFIKRVIGLPGETVNIVAGKVYINDSEVALSEPYLPEEMIGDYGPYEVPPESYFVLGDNRNHSGDSRDWTNKYVHIKSILSKAMLRYFPFNKISIIR